MHLKHDNKKGLSRLYQTAKGIHAIKNIKNVYYVLWNYG